ncbi:MAG: MFS transporter [Candidatus Omnitrophica bacterium]|nr:MFS transporter [Candidatus Omnitrophota bacterium]
MKAVVYDGIMSHLMGVLTGGVFLVAIALKLGASNFQIGLLAAIPPMMQLTQLPAILLIEKIRSRKTIAVCAACISRLGWLLIALSPFLFPPAIGLTLLLIAVIFQAGLGGIGGCAWNSWMRDLIPENKMGSFFSKRLKIATLLGIFVSLLASMCIDWLKSSHPSWEIRGYSLLFGVGFALGIIGVYFLARTPETKMAPKSAAFLTMLAEPFKDLNFKRLLIFIGSWSFAVNLAAPFFTVYMLKRIGLGMSMIVALSIISQAFNFMFLGIWGKWTDRYSNKSVLAVSGPLFMLSILAWTFTTMPEKYVFTMPLLFLIHIVMGISTAGVTIASGNIGLKLAPKGKATAYLATNTLINSIAAGIAPLIGGKFADHLASYKLSFVVNWSSPGKAFTLQTLNFQHWDFFFALAFVLGIYALHRLSFIREEGEVDDEVVRDEFISTIKRPLRSLSSGAGLFQLISYPFSSLMKKNSE